MKTEKCVTPSDSERGSRSFSKSRTPARSSTEYERMPRPPEGFAACQVGSGPQVTHLVILDTKGSNGGRPTLCRLTRFPTRGTDGEVLLDADLPGWSMGGGYEGPGVRQIECDDCYERLDRIAALRALPFGSA